MRQSITRPHPVAVPDPSSPWVARVGLFALLAATASLYLWDLDESGFANDYYAAAAQAGATSWKAFLFGSLDAGNAITVDKTPLALWPISLSVRMFGLSSFAVLMPQALEGVATVAILHATVRRTTGSAAAGLLAGAVLALTPIGTLVFRYDNPDSMLTLLTVAAAAATLRGVDDDAALRWLALAGALVGLGFLTKMLEVLLVVPALVVTCLWWARGPLRRRVAHVAVAGGAAIAAAGWWVALVQLWPADQRPWIGGSTTNNVLEVVLGYNGLGRLTGNETAGATSVSGWRLADAGHLFNLDIAGAALWLVPAGLLLGVGGVAMTRPGPADRSTRSALTLWLVWLVTVFATFSLMTGIFHSYYVVLLSPAVAAAVAIGGHQVWSTRRLAPLARLLLACVALVTAALAFLLLAAAPDGFAWMRWAAPSVLLVAAVVLVRRPRSSVVRSGMAYVAVLAALVAPSSYSVATALEPHTGSGPHAGPGRGNAPSPRVGAHSIAAILAGIGSPAAPEPTGSQAVDAEVTGLLRHGAPGYRWTAATGGAIDAAALELASGAPVIAIGGYKGTDPTPDLEAFVGDVHAGEVHYFVAGGRSGPAEHVIAQWVAARYAPIPISGTTVYDLSAVAG